MSNRKATDGSSYHRVQGESPVPWVGWQREDGSDVEDICIPADSTPEVIAIYYREAWQRLERRLAEVKAP